MLIAIKSLKSAIKHLKLFDWIIIVFGLFSIFIFATLFFRKSSYITATITIGEDSIVRGTWEDVTGYNTTGPKYWIASMFNKGQKEKDGLGKIQAEILDVYSYDKTPSHKAVYLKVKLNTVYNRATNTNTYKGTPVLVGSTIKLNLDNVYAEGIVTEVEGFPNYQRQNILIEAQIRDENSTFIGSSGTKDYVANAVQKGDVVRDNNGANMMEVLDKKVMPAEVNVITNSGKIIKAYDPVRKNVFLTLKVSAQMIDDRYYFLNDIPILIDQPIPINTPTVTLFPTVTKFLTY